MECRHSKTGERTCERSALSRFLLHKYVLLNTSQSFILQVSGGGHFPKGSGTKPHQEELSSGSSPSQGGGTSALWVLSALPALWRAGPRISSILWSFQPLQNFLSPHGRPLWHFSVSARISISLPGPMGAHSCIKGVYTTSRGHISGFSKVISQLSTMVLHINGLWAGRKVSP